MAYTDTSNLYLVFGKQNIRDWADLDNTQNDYSIDARVSWAISLAEEIINAELRTGPYDIPFSVTPAIIQHLTSLRAGLLLYEGRRVATDENQDQTSSQMKSYKVIMRALKAGQFRLDADLLTRDYPFVPEED